LPSLLAGRELRGRTPGFQFQLALETLQKLECARIEQARGLSIEPLAATLRVDSLQLEPVLEALCKLDWIGLLHEQGVDEAARYVLLADPDTTPLAPLLQALLLGRQDSTESLWKNGDWTALRLREAL
jgi:membrane protein